MKPLSRIVKIKGSYLKLEALEVKCPKTAINLVVPENGALKPNVLSDFVTAEYFNSGRHWDNAFMVALYNHVNASANKKTKVVHPPFLMDAQCQVWRQNWQVTHQIWPSWRHLEKASWIIDCRFYKYGTIYVWTGLLKGHNLLWTLYLHFKCTDEWFVSPFSIWTRFVNLLSHYFWGQQKIIDLLIFDAKYLINYTFCMFWRPLVFLTLHDKAIRATCFRMWNKFKVNLFLRVMRASEIVTISNGCKAWKICRWLLEIQLIVSVS